MSAVIAPGIAPGLAPPAAESPPASSSSSNASSTGRTFADTVAEHSAREAAANAASEAPPAAEQAASEPNAPPGDPTAGITTATDAASVLALVNDLIRGATAEGTQTEDTAPLLDRPAGAGDAETDTTDVNAMEALMAQVLPVRIPVPEDVTTAPVAIVAAGVDASGGATASALDALREAVADVASYGDATATTSDAAPAAEATIDAAAAATLEAPALTAPASDAAEPQTAAASAAQAAVAALDALATDEAAGTEVDAPQSGGASVPAATTEAPASAVPAEIVDAVVAPSPAGERTDGEHTGGEPRRARSEAAPASTAMSAHVGAAQGDHLATGHVTGSARAEVATGGAVTSQIANTVQSAVLRGEHEVRLVLNPPELGRVEIQVTETATGIRVHMAAEHAGARDLIERQLPLLQQALAARDVRVERLDVGRPEDAASAQQWSSSQGSNDGQRRREQRQDGGSPDWSPLAAMGLGSASVTRPERPRAATAGGLDVMA